MNELNNFKVRCGNCGRYPFCNKTNGANCCCNEWIKTNVEEEINYENNDMSANE